MVGCAARFRVRCTFAVCGVEKFAGDPESERCHTERRRFDLGSLLATNDLTLVVPGGPLKAHPKDVSRCVVKSTVYSTCSLPRLFVHDNVMKAINE